MIEGDPQTQRFVSIFAFLVGHADLKELARFPFSIDIHTDTVRLDAHKESEIDITITTHVHLRSLRGARCSYSHEPGS